MTETRRQQVNAAANRYYWRKKRERQAAGQTTRGTTPVYRRWTELGALHGQERHSEQQRRRRRENINAGYTARGHERQRTARPELRRLLRTNPGKYHNTLCNLLNAERRVSKLEVQWRALRAEMELDR